MFDRARRLVNEELERLLPEPAGVAATVAEAMRYAVLAGGKRLRPMLALAANAACGGDERRVLAPAAALELIHTYSLVHDDLPSMDDDDLRRGRPTVHRAYDEAVAVLVGDALQALAFEILARDPTGSAHAPRRAEAVLAVAGRVGLAGMVGGQIGDLEAERRRVDAERLEWIHRAKTGALFAAAAEVGAIHAGAHADIRRELADFGLSLGLAFQITDDLLDGSQSVARLGKTPGKDLRSGKATYPALHGDDAARAFARSEVEGALRRLNERGLATDDLDRLARYAVARDR